MWDLLHNPYPDGYCGLLIIIISLSNLGPLSCEVFEWDYSVAILVINKMFFSAIRHYPARLDLKDFKVVSANRPERLASSPDGLEILLLGKKKKKKKKIRNLYQFIFPWLTIWQLIAIFRCIPAYI